MGKTSSEVKNRWNAKTYRRYQVNLKLAEDAELIDFIESVKGEISASDIFRAGAEKVKNEGI